MFDNLPLLGNNEEDFFPNHQKTFEDYEDEELVDIPLDMSVEEIGKLALAAHSLDMKLNDFLREVVIEAAERDIAEHEATV